MNTQDKRPDPKPRKHAQLWQAYLWWDEIMQMRKKHLLRISSIEAGKSNLDLQFEKDMIEAMQLNLMLKNTSKVMAMHGKEIPVWEWMTGIKGVGDHTAAKILALIDDIGKFDTISKLWRHAGYAVINGKAERNQPGEESHFNRRLKSELYLLVGGIIKAQSGLYCDLYYSEKSRLRTLHPEKIIIDGKTKYNDGHLHNMAIRKVVKVFLSHLWLLWREREGLPTSEPYPIAHLEHHTHMIEVEIN